MAEHSSSQSFERDVQGMRAGAVQCTAGSFATQNYNEQGGCRRWQDKGVPTARKLKRSIARA